MSSSDWKSTLQAGFTIGTTAPIDLRRSILLKPLDKYGRRECRSSRHLSVWIGPNSVTVVVTYHTEYQIALGVYGLHELEAKSLPKYHRSSHRRLWQLAESPSFTSRSRQAHFASRSIASRPTPCSASPLTGNQSLQPFRRRRQVTAFPWASSLPSMDYEHLLPPRQLDLESPDKRRCGLADSIGHSKGW